MKQQPRVKRSTIVEPGKSVMCVLCVTLKGHSNEKAVLVFQKCQTK